MSGTIIVGLSAGDESKARITDYLAQNADVVCRFNGGPNAGHTVIVGENKYVFRLIPSGILNPKTICVMGQGMVVDPLVFQSELLALQNSGIDLTNRLLISDSVHVIMPYHIMADAYRESVAVNKLGTTKKGIGPCYEDKVARKGIRIKDLSTSESLAEMNQHRWMHPGATPNWSMKEYLKQANDILQPYATDVPMYLEQAFKNNKEVLFEGAQGFILDLDHGTYPYVTSSSATAGGALTGAGVGPRRIQRVVGVSKGYVTRVGEGPFPTELKEEDSSAQIIREKGHEYGSVTGRARRIGWLDLVDLKRACVINGVTDLVISKIDIMSHLKLDKFPIRTETGIKELPGWKQDISKARAWDELPESAQNYLKFIEQEVEVPISLVSVGPERDSIIVR